MTGTNRIARKFQSLSKAHHVKIVQKDSEVTKVSKTPVSFGKNVRPLTTLIMAIGQNQ